MFTRALVALAISAAEARVVKVVLRRGSVAVSSAYSVPLPVGCLDEGTGRVEDPLRLADALRGIPLFNGEERSPKLVHLVVPKQLCFTNTITAPASAWRLSSGAFLHKYRAALPGDPAALIVDLHREAVTDGGARRVMLVAAKRDALAGYIRVVAGLDHEVTSVTTGEIARYNLAYAGDPEVAKRCAFIAALEVGRAEVAIWDRGLLVASDDLSVAEASFEAGFNIAQLARSEGYAARGQRLFGELRRAVRRGIALGFGSDLITLTGALKGSLPVSDGSTGGTTLEGLELRAADAQRVFKSGGLVEVGARVAGGEFDDALGALLPFTTPNSGIRWREHRDQSQSSS
ncbi:MAG: hypothetical protein ACK5Y6_00285 [Pseudomonadota bacterium]